MPNFVHRIIDLYRKSFSGLPRKVWLLALVMLVNRSGAMVVAFLSVYLISAQGYEPVKAGYVMAAFGTGGIVGNYVGGLLNDRFGSWHIMLYSMIGAGLLNVALGQVSGFWPLCVLAFLISLFADAFRPANRAAIAIYTPPEKITQAFGLLRMAVNLGISIGPAVGGFFIFRYGFTLMFWMDGLTFLLAAVVFRFALPPDETARPLLAKEAADKQQPHSLDGHLITPPLRTRPAHRQPWLLLFALANTLIILCFFQLFNTMPVFMKESGFDEQQIGILLTINGLLIVAVEMPMLYVMDRRYRPITVMIIGAALIGGGYLLLPVGVTYYYFLVVVMLVTITFGEILYMPFTNTYVARHAPPARRGEYLGLLSASFSAGFVVGPLLGFSIAEHYGYGAAIYVCSGLAGVGALLLTTVNRLREQNSAVAGPSLAELDLQA
ncbi:MFS transporter [Neolewinella lacunae]|uniref:MFS transporter n=1 Tax=Neolewinella lacunae TaxID=1517758 RepID=A0A923T8A9_9BACT|nr:MFS transporter [Neolewinella lacunae]MBC6994374.1 MFS transporter [Neolewinella lacunae]MDN3633305.1 MFS transporter [Neolewinella lacunae]